MWLARASRRQSVGVVGECHAALKRRKAEANEREKLGLSGGAAKAPCHLFSRLWTMGCAQWPKGPVCMEKYQTYQARPVGSAQLFLAAAHRPGA